MNHPAFARIAAWGAAAAPAAKALAQRRDADGPMIDRALELVRRFVAARGLVLFGGLAIDYALRLRGAAIYPDDERPDYDALSATAVGDAYDLADALHRAGFANVGAIRAKHAQTVRVRVDFRPVADIGYADAAVLAALPTIEFRGLRAVHPDFQRLDMHLALCYPFDGAPRENVFHRWRKDIKRFNMFEELYPLASAPPASAAPASAAPALAAAEAYSILDAVVGAPGAIAVRFGEPIGRAAEAAGAAAADRLTLPGPALAGFAAYGALRAAAAAALSKSSLGPEARAAAAAALAACPELPVTLDDDYTVRAALPAGAPREIAVASLDPAASLDLSAGGAGGGVPCAPHTPLQWFDSYAEVYPPSARRAAAGAGEAGINAFANAIAISTRWRLLAASELEIGGRFVTVASPQFVCLTLLCDALRAAGGDARAACRAYYNHTLALIRAAELIYPDFGASPFAPGVRTMGDPECNYSAAYVLQVATAAARLQEAPPAALKLGGFDIAALLEGLPQNYFPGRASADANANADANASHPEFVPGPLFHLGGARRPGNDACPF